MKQGLLIDMDGVIYSGELIIEGADKFTCMYAFLPLGEFSLGKWMEDR